MKAWIPVACIAVLVPPLAAAPSPDPLTPADAEVIVRVNVRQMLRTPVVQKHALDPLKLLLQRNEELRQLLTAAGLDPLKDVDTIGVSTSGNPTHSGKLLAVVRGKFDPAKVRTAAGEYARKHPGRLKSLREGERSLWEITSDNKSYFAAFAGEDALVMTTTKEDTIAVVACAAQPPQRLNKAMQAALDQVKGDAPIWLAMVATDSIKQLLKGDELAKNFAESLQSVTGTIDLTDDALLTLIVHSSSVAAAGQIKDKLEDLLKLLAFVSEGKDPRGQIAKEVIDNLKLGTDKGDVSIRVKVTDAQLGKFRKSVP
jgi:hypothetical protein